MLLYDWLSCECLFCLIFSSCEEWIFTSSVPKGLPTLPSLSKLLYFILIFFELLISYFLCHKSLTLYCLILSVSPGCSQLSSLRLCGNSCTWVHYIRLHFVATLALGYIMYAYTLLVSMNQR